MVLAIVAYLILMDRARAGVDAAFASMPDMAHGGGVWAYSMSQAFGFAALVWSWLTIMLGLSVSTRLWRGRLRARATVERLHRTTSLTVIALMVAHAVFLIWDQMGDTPMTVFIPFAPTSYQPGQFPTALGILALYGALLFGPSFYLRNRLGPRLWRVVHRVIIPAVYALGVWHTFLYGSDVKSGTALWFALWALQIPVIVAFVTRMVVPARRSERLLPGRSARSRPE